MGVNLNGICWNLGMCTCMSPHTHRTGSWFQMETDGKRRVGEPQLLPSALRLKNAKFELAFQAILQSKSVKGGGLTFDTKVGDKT